MESKVTGIVFAGGKSSRMGQNKALVKYKHHRLIDLAIGIISPACDYLLISSNEHLKNVPYTMVTDIVKDLGPIGGLYSALKKSDTDDNLIIACDVPNIEMDFFDKLIAKSKGYDAVIPRLANGKLEPLVAYYSRSIIPIIEEQIKNENFKLIDLILELNVRYIDVKNDAMFKNINTPEDLE